MTFAGLRDARKGEARGALVPGWVKLNTLEHNVAVEPGAGLLFGDARDSLSKPLNAVKAL
jgi:hypothetical protein